MPAIAQLPPGLPTVSPSRSTEWCPIAQHTWLQSTGNMASKTKEVNFKFYLILINLYLKVNIHTCPWLPYRMVPKQKSVEGTNAHVHSSGAMVKLRSNHVKGGGGAEESMPWADPFNFDLLGFPSTTPPPHPSFATKPSGHFVPGVRKDRPAAPQASQ